MHDLPERGAAYALECLRATRVAMAAGAGEHALGADDRALLDDIRARLDALEADWEIVAERCAAMPATLVHGDLVAKNLRVRATGAGGALVAFDWSCGGRGAPAFDLAQMLAPSRRFCADPDVFAYWSVVRDCWPGCSIREVREWATIGTVFRALVTLHWLAPRLANGSVADAAVKMRGGRDNLARAMRALAWDAGIDGGGS